MSNDLVNVSASATNTNIGVATSHSNVLPELDAKLGAMYTYAMAQGDLSLDVGWVWAHYVNALNSLDTAVGAGSDLTRPRSFGIQGLYFGAKWVGNVA